MKFNSNDYSFRPTTMSDAFERSGLLGAMQAAGMVKGPHLVREAIVESDRGVIHTESARNALGQIMAAKAA